MARPTLFEYRGRTLTAVGAPSTFANGFYRGAFVDVFAPAVGEAFVVDAAGGAAAGGRALVSVDGSGETSRLVVGPVLSLPLATASAFAAPVLSLPLERGLHAGP